MANGSSYEPTVYTLLLTGMCLLLALFLLTRLLVALRNKNKLLAWSTCFYALCLLWTVVRSAYWIIMLSQESMPYLTLYLLYWSPTPIQFANFSLLILFYIQVLTGPEWRSRWRNVCLPLYLLLTMCMATFTAVWALNSSNDISKAARRGDEYDQEFSHVSDVSVQLKYSAASFFLLSVLFGVFGWKMANVRAFSRRFGNLQCQFDGMWGYRVFIMTGGELEAKATAYLQATGTQCDALSLQVDCGEGRRLTFMATLLAVVSAKSLAVINSLLCFIFFTRGIRDLATSQSWFLSIWNNLDMNGRVTTFAYFIFFCFWEFLPTVLLLCLISSKAGGVGGEGKLLTASPLSLSAYGSYSTHVDSSTTGGFEQEPERPRWTHGGDLFQDPLRYDSDDGPLPSPRHLPDSFNSDVSSSNYYYERAPTFPSV
ncbi:hypothetical protein BBJ28_00023192 [Nothophytophthora sp. Chile5]|nr:hypothetical protein BBJ28_00023192 [Nothophytophthora sp. Chile5]